jgi:hypothetical protein
VLSSNPGEIFPYFFALWAVLGIGSSAFFFLNRNAPLKRRLWPIVSIGASVLFIGFLWLMGILGKGFLFVVLFVGVITLLNLRMMKFCKSCGRTLMNQNPFSPPNFCPKCGAGLDPDA